MIDADIISGRLGQLKVWVKQLRAIGRLGKRKVCKNDITYAALERYLQLAVECVLDVGNHLIVGLNLSKPATYEDVMQILAEGGVLSKKLSRKSQEIPALRTQLVHANGELGREKLFDSARDLASTFEEFAEVYKKFL